MILLWKHKVAVLAMLICFALQANLQWTDGFYLNNDLCYQWDGSCKTCDDTTAWTSWEDYMFLNSTSGYCTFCADGEYYDDTFEQCRSWEGKWTGDWAYQTTCFECTNGEMLDTDTLTWVTECSSPKIAINDSQFTVDSICRGNDFYVDPESSSILEIGSKDNPYRSMRALMSEILNHHSNQDKVISIYLKENTEVFLEDETNFLINITQVKISSYSDTQEGSQMATLIPTKNPQNGVSMKSAFSILQNADLKLEEIIAASDLTDYEIETINSQSRTIILNRWNIEIDNIRVEHRPSDFGFDASFIYAVYLQEKLVNITNSEFNVTGNVLLTFDSLSLYVVNMVVDLYRSIDAISINPRWNYPEASKLNELYIDNFTVVEVGEKTIFDSAFAITIAGAANCTFNNIDLTCKL